MKHIIDMGKLQKAIKHYSSQNRNFPYFICGLFYTIGNNIFDGECGIPLSFSTERIQNYDVTDSELKEFFASIGLQVESISHYHGITSIKLNNNCSLEAT